MSGADGNLTDGSVDGKLREIRESETERCEMEYQTLHNIIEELRYYAGKVKEEEAQKMVEQILKANRIFVAGAGRSGFAARGFANRLMHLGFQVAFIGEPTTPPIKAGDLLVIGSGSGTTASLVKMAEKAKSVGVAIATVTIAPENTIGSMADAVITLPGTTRQLLDGEPQEGASIQPVGSMFEQMSWLVYDSLIMDLREKTGQSLEQMLERHGNLE